MTSNKYLGFDVNAPGTTVFIIQLVFLILAWITSILRAWVKISILKKVTIDDLLMLLALLGYSVSAYFTFTAIIDGGLGLSPAILSLDSSAVSLRGWLGNMILSGPVSALFRISIALFLLKIAILKWHRVVLHAIITLAVLTSLAYFFIVLLQCSPPSYFWQRVMEDSSGSCSHTDLVHVTSLAFCSIGIATDLALGLLPIAILWNARISRQSKVGIVCLLSFAIIAGTALLIRLIYLAKSDVVTSKTSLYGTLAVSITAIIELSLGIFAGCLATLSPLLGMISMFGLRRKRCNLHSPNNTLPWQMSPTRPRFHEDDSTTMVSIGRGGSAQGILKHEDRASFTISRAHSPFASRWDMDLDDHDGDIEDSEALPAGKRIKVRTFIRVISQPSGEVVLGRLDAVDHTMKPLPLVPPSPLPFLRPPTPELRAVLPFRNGSQTG
ncbi:hypothetical protein GGR57DRAFT_472470 [Xylariaceae sp. FL1272]|nr:hypothetical protein GGR57DRAFT_472470 [Xylariaceae sp. FL1272]